MRKLKGHSREISVIVLVILITSSTLIVVTNIATPSNSSPHLQSPKVTNPKLESNHQNSQVNPYLSYIKEPAPMGIADYGLGLNRVPYNYSSESFLGVIDVNSLKTYNSSRFVLGNVTFQLNLNMVFSYEGKSYVYWVQDVLYLNTSNNEASFLDNIWNLSSSNANMFNSTVLGNGTVSSAGNSYFYFDFASNSSSGNNISLKYPTTIYLKMNATVSSLGIPEVVFLYNDGYGWIVYDKAIFHFVTKSGAVPYFYVDGAAYNPSGAYYDAELVMGGPGNGSQTSGVNSSLYLMLDYYNGNNYQAIQNAYNFGSDTLERVNNFNSSGVYNVTNGQLASSMSPGLSPLGLIYSSGDLSSLMIVSSIKDGALFVNGTNLTEFSDYIVNVTLFPGTYSVKLYDYATGVYTYLGNVTLSAGKQSKIIKDVYRVEFLENGLPPSSQWDLNITGIASVIVRNLDYYNLYLPNGTYNYSIYSSDKNYLNRNESGSMVVNGSSLTIKISFNPILFGMSFVESGLPKGSSWSVNLIGAYEKNSTNDTVIFDVTNGTYDFTIATSSGYASSPSQGSVTVNGKPTLKNVTFSIINGSIVGSIVPANASIYVNGTMYKPINGQYNISLIPGNYSVEISAQGYKSYTTNVTVTSNNATHILVTSLSRNSSPSSLIYLIVVIILFAAVGISIIRSRR